jgi:hypothetical protein
MIGTALAVAGSVLQGAGLLKGFSDDKSARKSMKRIRRAKLRMMDVGYREQSRQSFKQESALKGAQRAGFAGAGAVAGRGTGRLLEEETSDEFARSRQLAALTFSAERTSAIEGGSTSSPNYFSGLSSLAGTIGSAYGTAKAEGVLK